MRGYEDRQIRQWVELACAGCRGAPVGVLDAGAVSCQPPSQPNKIFPITSRHAAAQQQPLGTGRSQWDCQIVSSEASEALAVRRI